jgi:hypothetical protein
MRTGRRWLAALGISLTLAACAGARARGGDLGPPADAPAWDTRYDLVFDDHYTALPVELSGRAPGDVVDQRRFAQRLGFADLIALVTVDQVWSRGLYEGTPRQQLDVTVGRVLLGELPKGTRREQVLQLRGGEDLPANLTGRVMLLFLRWAPGEGAGYHHHVMPADEAVITLIEAMVRHARAEGKLERPRQRGRRRGGKSAAKVTAGETDDRSENK